MQRLSSHNYRRASLVLVATVATLLVVTQVAQAFTYRITNHRKYKQGSSKVVEMAGSYALDASESRLTRVSIVTYDASGKWLSEAAGSVTATTWKAGVGDFRLISYQVKFTIILKTGATKTVLTPKYTW